MTYGVYNLLMTAFRLLELLLCVYAAASWIMPDSSFYQGLGRFFDPLLSPFRKLLQKILPNSRIDFSPIAFVLALDILRRLVSSVWTQLFF